MRRSFFFFFKLSRIFHVFADSSIRSVDEPYHMDSHESISESLAEKIGNISFEEERILRTVK